MIPLLYENPELVWLGFKDPSFPLPKVIENLFPHWVELLGTARGRLRHLITQKESRKFGRGFSAVAALQVRLGGERRPAAEAAQHARRRGLPGRPEAAYARSGRPRSTARWRFPTVDLETDIGGYAKVKQRLKAEVLDLLARRDKAADVEEVSRLEELIPRGMIFWGPPGTGKTYFAKAIAAGIGAAVTVVSGPELKSKWVGESEENLRQIFHKARQSAPAIIVFDEFDSFATARGTYTGSGVEHSMVNQLLTEMDGFHKDELVFVVGTTNFVESLDPALLRPGRFEFHLHIPYPDDDDRREIVLDLRPQDAAPADARGDRLRRPPDRRQLHDADRHAVQRRPPERPVSGRRPAPAPRRHQRRDDAQAPRAGTDRVRGPGRVGGQGRRHGGHARGRAFPVRRDSARTTRHRRRSPSRATCRGPRSSRPSSRTSGGVGHSRNELLDILCVLYGGIEAERLLVGDVSTGASGFGNPRSDLARATELASIFVDTLGMSALAAPLRTFRDKDGRREVLSGSQAEAIDRQVNTLIVECQARAAAILAKHKADLIALRDELLDKKTIEGDRVKAILADLRGRFPADVGAPGPEVPAAAEANPAREPVNGKKV